MLFTSPLALLGLLSLPALATIYWLRARYRPHPVSSLMLWRDPHRPREGGTRLDRLQTPLLFFVELLILLLLTLAAAGPRLPLALTGRPLAVVLDDSFSMRAGGAESPRTLAAAALEEEVRRRAPSTLYLVLAGERPRTLVGPAPEGSALSEQLQGWACQAPTARLDEAVGLASELAGASGRVLVLTDHAPVTAPTGERVEWRAFGRPRPNLALVAAARSEHQTGERCLLEVANLSDQPRTATLTVETIEPPALLSRVAFPLGPGESIPHVLALKEGVPAVRARLEADDLDFDNEAILLPAAHRPVRVRVRIGDAALRALVERGLKAARGVEDVAEQPDLLLTDGDDEAPGDAWVVRLRSAGPAAAYDGPFVVDRTHPLTAGLPLEGVVWGAGRAEGDDGRPVLLAGNAQLLTDAEDAEGRHRLQLYFRPAASTLQQSPAWPVLMWNLVQWRSAHLPGPARANLRLGEDAALTFAAPVEQAEVLAPDGLRRTAPASGRRLVLHPDEIGVYRVRAGGEEVAFAVHAAARDESDLSGCASGRWGESADDAALRLEAQDAAWPLLALALAVTVAHQYLVARGRGRGRL
jgi:hypothetical protein